MKISFSQLMIVTLGALTCGAAVFAAAQISTKTPTSHAQLLRAELKPGEVLRYELEGSSSFLPQADSNSVTLKHPPVPCDYSVAAIVTLRPQPVDKDGNTPVEATYGQARVTSVKCHPIEETQFQKRLDTLQKAPITFRVGPHGETGLTQANEQYVDYWNGADLLRKITRDLLQTQFSTKPVVPGDSWKPRGQFAYSKDYQLHQLELSAANLRFRDIVPVDGKSCAWVTSKYIFSPLDLPASTTTPEGRVVQGGANNAVAAILEISLLLDPVAHHVAWLQRSQTIDNRLTLAVAYGGDADDEQSADDPPGYDPDQPDEESPMPDMSGMRAGNPNRHPLMTFHLTEDARARLLPEERSMEWLAALKRFEQSPEPENATAPIGVVPGPIAKAAQAATLKKTTRVVVDSDTLAATPVGFTRYEKPLCRDAWFCATVSVALPGRIEVSEDTPLRSVYLAKKNDVDLSIAIGPALDRRNPGLTDEEELGKQAKYYLSNYVWLAVKPGIGTNSSSATLDGYPASVTEFNATQRDLANIRGVLGLVLTPWGKVVPVSCTSDHAYTAELQSICEQVISSTTVRR